MEVIALVSPALVAGAVSFRSLCVVPLPPGSLSNVTGLCGTPSGGRAPARRLGLAQRRRVRVGAGLFVGGFATVFTVLGGATVSVLGLIEFAGGIGLAITGVLMMTGDWTLIMSRMLAVYARLQWPPI
ncbi:hypothetical protein I4I84_02940 [Pseudonocardia sp. KRD-182]|uniref:hypothetical protein n=1 Tax=Pseudonocardia oceani TaxID=2792013 RepID=UPI001C49E76C|nr:hypothetical protein [Pseudonocardia oceani]MBW0107692.1 hypothetical protein [Pseudonocardia oceani]